VGGFIILHSRCIEVLSVHSNSFTQCGNLYRVLLVQLGETRHVFDGIAHTGSDNKLGACGNSMPNSVTP
jgi:hypothetical protein